MTHLITAYRAGLDKAFYGLLTTPVPSLSSPSYPQFLTNHHELSAATLRGTEAADPGFLLSALQSKVTSLQLSLGKDHLYKRGELLGKTKEN